MRAVCWNGARDVAVEDVPEPTLLNPRDAIVRATSTAICGSKFWGHSPAGIFGYSHMLGGYADGQAEYVRVPFADIGPIQVPDELPGDCGMGLRAGSRSTMRPRLTRCSSTRETSA